MVNLLIVSSKKATMHLWIDTLDPLYTLSFSDNIERILSDDTYQKEKILLVLDVSLLTEKHNLSLICQYFYKVIVVGDNCTPEQKIQCISKGAWGYSDYLVDKQLIVRTIESILNDEVWLERQLIPRLLHGAVARSNLLKVDEEFNSETLKILSILTQREIEVVKLVYNGKNNISIAQTLSVSNRTVKAHLSAIYRKLNVPDRFQLIVFLKNLHLGYLSSADVLLDDSK